jgi:hypothetical protein
MHAGRCRFFSTPAFYFSERMKLYRTRKRPHEVTVSEKAHPRQSVGPMLIGSLHRYKSDAEILAFAFFLPTPGHGKLLGFPGGNVKYIRTSVIYCLLMTLRILKCFFCIYTRGPLSPPSRIYVASFQHSNVWKHRRKALQMPIEY